MPLLKEARALIRANLEEIQKGHKARLVVVAKLTDAQRDAINQARTAHNRPHIVAAVVFIGSHIYRSRVVRDGYTFDDVIDQIASGMVPTAVVLQSPQMTAMENPDARADRYGNLVRD